MNCLFPSDSKPSGRTCKQWLAIIALLVIGCWLSVIKVALAQDKKPEKEISVSIESLKYSRSEDKDIIDIDASTKNLPAGTILNCRVNSMVFMADLKDFAEQEVIAYLTEVSEGGKATAKIDKFPWLLPPSLYIITIELAAQQKKKVASLLPKEKLGKPLKQEEIIIGDFKDSPKDNYDNLIEIQKVWSYYGNTVNALTEFCELYNKKAFSGKEKRVSDWHNQIKRDIKVFMDKAGTVTRENFPGLYRLSYLLISGVGMSLLSQEDGIIQTMTGATGRFYDPTDPAPTRPILKTDFKIEIEKGRQLAVKESIFNMMLMLNYLTKDMALTYQKIKEQSNRQSIWSKAAPRWTDCLKEFDRYYKEIRKDYETELLKPMFEDVATAQEHFQNMLDTYSSLVAAKEGQDTLQKEIDTRQEALNDLFKKAQEELLRN